MLPPALPRCIPIEHRSHQLLLCLFTSKDPHTPTLAQHPPLSCLISAGAAPSFLPAQMACLPLFSYILMWSLLPPNLLASPGTLGSQLSVTWADRPSALPALPVQQASPRSSRDHSQSPQVGLLPPALGLTSGCQTSDRNLTQPPAPHGPACV